ncbi:hypothetical protein N6L24_14550 [Cognatishimia sp. SS12]|uniref:hypothetical protein n=1 Tax=Cognatishimia sp. SS12 TaxID=2979465 RepID=UPI002330EF0F|nr:hypothetical protein [Cognatishimia sp. SS12]MDC0739506.1 hypothetical protein [Cognatishimia sp. SS12]
MKLKLLGVLSLCIPMVAVSGASAATCADRDHVTARLADQFGEAPVANTVSRNNHVLEVFASPNAETWSIVVTLPERNLACLAATGKGQVRLTSTLQSL